MTGLLPNYHGAQSQINQLEHASFDIKYLLTDNSLNEWSVCVFLSKIAIDHTESTRKLVLKQGNGLKRVNIKFLSFTIFWYKKLQLSQKNLISQSLR